MRERDRISLREFRDEQAAIEAAEREQRDRPIRELTEKLNEGHRRLAALEREALTSVPDPDRWLDPIVGPDVVFTETGADAFNREQTAVYRAAHPETYWCPELVTLLAAYFSKERIVLVSSAMLHRLIARFANAGLLPERPAEPEPESIAAQPIEPAKPQPLIGIDPMTGEEKEYTPYQVNLMSSDEYRRAFGIRLVNFSGAPRRFI